MVNPGPETVLILNLISEKRDSLVAVVGPSIRTQLHVQPSIGPLKIIFCEPLYVGWTVCARV
jgi:hypothetical protein